MSSITSGLEVDFLVALGLVARVWSAYVGAEELGPVGPAFRRALVDGTVEYYEADEGVHLTALRAAAQFLPFGVWTASLGTSIPEHNPTVTEVLDALTDRFYLESNHSMSTSHFSGHRPPTVRTMFYGGDPASVIRPSPWPLAPVSTRWSPSRLDIGLSEGGGQRRRVRRLRRSLVPYPTG